MDNKKYLGVHLKPDTASAVLLDSSTEPVMVKEYLSVKPDPEKDGGPVSIASLISRTCKEKQAFFDECFAGISCGSYTSHIVHSQFTNYRQIAQTIRFDAEEAIATDATQVAIAFNLISSDQDGSNVTVFSADRKMMAETVSEFQAERLDPVAIEPDVACLARFIKDKLPSHDSNPLYVLLTDKFGYIVSLGNETASWQCRTFLIGSTQNRTSVLINQIPLTTASLGIEAPSSILVYDFSMKVELAKLCAILGTEVRQLDLENAVGSMLPGIDRSELVNFAIACGAALGQAESVHVDFRQDFMPYQGRKMQMEKCLKMLSICLTAMFISLGLFFQLKVHKNNWYSSQLKSKLQSQYAAVITNPVENEDPIARLRRELNNIKQVKHGQSETGQASISVLLTYLLEVLNNSKNADLKIDSIKIGAKSIIITGDTPDRNSTISLLNTIDSHTGLKSSQNSYEFKSGRDRFQITILPKGR